jgi:hypothetical protein
MVIGAPDEASGGVGVGANQNDNTAPGAGAVYVFVHNGTNWEQQAYLKASNAGAGARFGSSVAISGDTVVVGAPNEGSSSTGVDGDQTDSGTSAGAVYVFTRNGDIWNQEAYLKASNTDIGDSFGTSVGLSGSTLAVGAVYEDSRSAGVDGQQSDNAGDAVGAVYVFVRNEGSWSQEAYLKASNPDDNDQFGIAVGISNETIAVGALLEDSATVGVGGTEADSGATDSGAVYVFRRAAGVWSQEAYIKPSNTGAGDWFGEAVSLDGDTLVVGAAMEDSSATGTEGGGAAQNDNSADNAGAAYVFQRTGAAWSQEAYLKASNTQTDRFGRSVGVSGDVIVVGAPYESSGSGGVGGDQYDNSTLQAGAAYLFVRANGQWSQQAYVKASNPGRQDLFGYRVAASGWRVVVGAYLEQSGTTGINGDQSNDGVFGAGAVYVLR